MTADLTVFQSSSSSTVGPGGTITYSLFVFNEGTTAASTIILEDTLPAGFTVISALGTQGFTATGLTPVNNVITFTGGNLDAGGQPAFINITGIVAQNATGSIQNVAVVDLADAIEEGINENNNVSNTVITTIDTNQGPDLTIVKGDVPDPVAPGGELTYSLLVQNNGSTNASNFVVRDTLPDGFTVSNITTDGNYIFSQAGNVITFTGSSLASGGVPSTITIVGTAPTTAGELVNIAVVDPDGNITEISEENNIATTTTSISNDLLPDLTIAKSGVTSTVVAGDTISYTLIVQNTGSTSASNIVVRDTLPSDFSFISATTDENFKVSDTTNNVVTFTGGSLDSVNGLATMTIVGTVSQNVSGNLLNTAVVDPDGAIAETDETNNTATISTTVGLPDLTIFKFGIPNSNLQAGDTVTYTLVVENNGTGPANNNNIVVRDTLPSNILVTDSDISVGSVGGFSALPISGNVVTFTGGSLGTDDVATFTIVGQLTSGGEFTNTAVVDPDNVIVESDDTNNTSTFTTNLAAPTIVYVDDDFSTLTLGQDPDGNGPIIGFRIDAFDNIQEGEQVVATGGTVQVFAGTYGELVGITKPVSLIGPNASINPNTQTRNVDEATITGTSAGIGFLSGASAGQVIVDGFRLEGAGTGPGDGAAIDLQNSGNNTIIRNNVITNVDNDAIRNFPKTNPLFDDTGNVVIENNLIDTISGDGSRRGMFLQEVNGLTVTGNVVRNITGGDNPGILLDTVTGTVVVSNNTVEDVASQGIQLAGIGSAGGTVTITGNVLRRVNEGPDGNGGTGDEDITNAGIRLRNSPFGAALNAGTVSITDNNVENTMNGLVIRDNADVSNVTVTNNRFDGIISNPGGSFQSGSGLSAGTYAIIHDGTGTLNAVGNFENAAGTDPLDTPDIAALGGSINI